jgi:hypothetical protein
MGREQVRSMEGDEDMIKNMAVARDTALKRRGSSLVSQERCLSTP